MHADWKTRLEQWAPEPPAAVWDRLNDELAQESKPAFAQKLYDFSAAPPQGAWEAIAATIEPATATPIIQMFPRNRFVRYASVAASVLLAFFLFRRSGADKTSVNSLVAPIQQESIITLPESKRSSNEISTNAPVHAAAVHLSYPVKRETENNLPSLQIDKAPLQTVAAERTDERGVYEIVPATVPQLNDGYLEKYIVVPITDDAAVRLSKKLYALFRCDDMPQQSGCAQLLNQLRQQTGTPSLLTSADFAGLLELIQQVNANQ